MIGLKAARQAMTTMGAAVALTLAATACGGGVNTDAPTTTVPTSETEVLVKNRPLNNCVSVFSGERPTTSRPQTREEQIRQREAEIAARPPECRPKR